MFLIAPARDPLAHRSLIGFIGQPRPPQGRRPGLVIVAAVLGILTLRGERVAALRKTA